MLSCYFSVNGSNVLSLPTTPSFFFFFCELVSLRITLRLKICHKNQRFQNELKCLLWHLFKSIAPKGQQQCLHCDDVIRLRKQLAGHSTIWDLLQPRKVLAFVFWAHVLKSKDRFFVWGFWGTARPSICRSHSRTVIILPIQLQKNASQT